MSEGENQELRVSDPVPRTVLAVARVAQSLSIADVARQLKLSERQVEALEAGAFDQLPGPVFVRGFIRNYARLLKLDPERVLNSVDPGPPARAAGDEAPPSPEIPFPAAPVRRWPKYMAAALLVIAGLVAYEFYWNEPAPVTVTRPAAPQPAAVSVAVPLPQDVTQGTATAPAAPEAGQAADSSAGSAAQPIQVTPGTSPASPRSEAMPGSVRGELHLVFEMESWVEIRDQSGLAIFSRLNPQGTEQRVTGSPPFTLVVGNARGVRLTYNDRPIDLERHTRVSVARLTVE